jgi:hypothetical protein
MTLPEMSVIDTHLPSNTKIKGYTVEQMLAWGKACAAAEREECAKLCEASKLIDYPTVFERVAISKCANAILARGNT